MYLGTTGGLRTITFGVTAPAVQLTSSSGLRSVMVRGAAIFGADSTSPYGIARPFNGATLPGGTAQAVSIPSSILPGTSASSLYVTSFAWDSAGALFTAQYVQNGTSGLFSKYTWNGASWVMAPNYPVQSGSVVFALPGGGTFSTGGLKGIVAGFDAAGVEVIFACTVTTTAGANYIIKHTIATQLWSHVAQAPAGYQYASLALPPVAPTPTNTPTASFGSSSSATGTPTPTPTATPTTTPLPCSAPGGAAAQAFGGRSVVLVRVGDGTRPLASASGRELFLDEVDLDSGARVQSIRVPSSPLGGDGSFVLNTNAPTEAVASRAADGLSVLIPAYVAPVQEGATIGAAFPKAILTLAHSGALGVAATYTSSSASIRSVAALASGAGSSIVALESTGIKLVPFGTVAGVVGVNVAALVATGGFRVAQLRGGALFVSNSSGVVLQVPNLADANQEPVRLASFTAFTTNAASFVFEDSSTIWMGDYAAAGGGLARFTLDAATGAWSLSPGFPRAVAVTAPATNVTYGGVRSMTPLVDAATGHFTLLFISAAPGAYANGGSALLRYDTADDVFSFVFATCMYTELRTMALAPQSATPSPSAAPTGAPTPTATGSLPAGAAPSSTSSNTPSASSTPSASLTPSAAATPTATPTPTPSPGTPFGAGRLAVLSAGDGVAVLSTLSAVANLLEVDPADGTVVQTISLGGVAPSTPLRSACMLYPGGATEGQLTHVPALNALAIPCYAWSNPAVRADSGTLRTIALVDALGVVDTTTVFSSSAGEAFRGVASLDGARFYLGTINGVKTVTYGGAGAALPQVAISLSSAATVRQVALGPDGGLYAAVGTSPAFGVSRVFGPPLPGGAPQVASVAAGLLPGTTAAGASTTGFHFDDEGALWTVAFSGTAGLLGKFALAGGAWAAAPSYPKTSVTWTARDGATAASASGLKSITGRRDAATDRYVLYVVAANGAALLAFDTVTQAFSPVLEAAPNTHIMSAAWAPVALSATPTPGAEPSASGTPPRTGTASSTPSLTALPTRTGSPTGTPTASGSPQACSAAAPGAAPQAFAAAGSSVTVLRVGVGTAALAGAVPAFLDEYDLATGQRLQSVAVPPRPADGCVVNTGVYTESIMTRATAGSAVLLACYSAPPGAAATAATPKALGAIDHTGAWALLAAYNTTSASVRSVAGARTEPGSVLYVTESVGVRAVTLGASGATAPAAVVALVTAGAGRGSLLSPGGTLYFANTSNVINALSPAQLADPVQPSVPAVLAGAASTNLASFVFEDEDTLWTGEWQAPAGIVKLTRGADGTWAPVAGYPVPANASWGGEWAPYANGVRSLTGFTDAASGHFTLLFTTGGPSVALGSNLLARYNTVTGEFATIARACMFTEFRSVALSPVAPSSSGTPSPSRDPAASPLPTTTSSASVSETPTASAAPTRSRTPTASSTPFCFPAAGAPAPFAPGSVVALRVGSGRPGIQTTLVAREAFLDEFDPATGARLQSIALPTGFPVVDAATGALTSAGGVTLQAGWPFEGQIGRTANGGALVLSGWAVPVGTLVVFQNHTRHTLTVGPDGVPTTAAAWRGGNSACRSTASIDGVTFYVSSVSAVLAVRAGAPNGTSVGTTAGFRGLTVWGGALYATLPGAAASVHALGGAAAADAGAPPGAGAGVATFALPGLTTNATGATLPSTVVFEDAGLTAWLVDYTNTTQTLFKFTRSTRAAAAPWARAPGFPVPLAVALPSTGALVRDTGRSMTGWTDPQSGAFHLLIAGSAGLIKYNTVTGAAAMLVEGCPNTQFRGIALAPVAPPTPSGTPSNTGSPSSTRTPASTGTPSATGTPSSSASRTGTPSPSASRTGTPSPSASATGSVSATSSETGSVSATA
jgi:hypothetical protein